MIPKHHPTDDILAAYASGATSEPMALIVATHLALCPDCRRIVGDFEALGGLLLDQLSGDDPDIVIPDLAAFPGEDGRPRQGAARGMAVSATGPLVPQPLRDYLGDGVPGLNWRKLGALSEARLLPDLQGITTQMLRIRAGAATPRHGHRGNEYTLVLAGGYSDHTGHYVRGDFAVADPSIEHRPVADPGEDCLCLAVTDAPLRLTGFGGRVVSMFLRG
jgi:putative transcriptional regulator